MIANVQVVVPGGPATLVVIDFQRFDGQSSLARDVAAAAPAGWSVVRMDPVRDLASAPAMDIGDLTRSYAEALHDVDPESAIVVGFCNASTVAIELARTWAGALAWVVDPTWTDDDVLRAEVVDAHERVAGHPLSSAEVDVSPVGRLDRLVDGLDASLAQLARAEDWDEDLLDTMRTELLPLYRGWFSLLSLSALTGAPGDHCVMDRAELGGRLRALVTESHGASGDGGPRVVTRLVIDQARRKPHAVAVSDAERTLTYAQLLATADEVASRLRACGVGRDDVVAVRAERSAWLVASLLGVWRSGAAYLPLDVAAPARRVKAVLDDAGVRVCLTDNSGRAGLTAADGQLVVVDIPTDVPAEKTVAPATVADELIADEDNLAYVIYTSGSTGNPKGVAIEQRSLHSRLAWMQRTFRLGPEDRVLQKTPYTFDVSVWEFFWPLAYGARLIVAEPGGHADPEYLVRVIVEEKVTIAHFVPSMLALVLDEPELARCRSLRCVVSSGEALPPSMANRFSALLPGILHNLYGPTEATIDVTHHACADVEPGPTVPIGAPIDDVELLVLDTEGRPVQGSQVGELYIGGIQVARGYLNRAELTRQSFVRLPGRGGRYYRTGDECRWLEHGELAFVGRRDDQVKVRGMRVELGEVAAVLGTHPEVTEAVVLQRHDLGTEPTLVGYLQPARHGVSTDDELVASVRTWARERLMDYMVPAAFVVVDQWPVTRHGKLDSSALQRPRW